MDILVGSVNININLQNDLYIIEDNFSAVGKTYLYNVLANKVNFDESLGTMILLVSSNVVEKEGINSVVNKVKGGTYSLIVLDRADRYMTQDLVNAIRVRQLAKDSIVLLDLKNWGRFDRLYPREYNINLVSPERIDLNVAYDF